MNRRDVLIRLIILLVLCSVIAFLNGNFLKPMNLINILRQGAILYIISIGMTLVVLSGGIDLSIGALVSVTSCLSAMAIKAGMPLFPGILLALVLGIIFGMMNGLVITLLKVPSFIATFAMMYFARGISYIALNGKILYSFSEEYRFIGTGYLFQIPIPVVISIIIMLIFLYILGNTNYGMNLYAIGSNEESSRLVGIKVKRVQILTYAISGLMAAVAGVIYTARLNTAEPVVGMEFHLDALAAVIIGGASINGGHGSLVGTIIGVFIMTVIMNGMNLLGISSLWQQFIIGIILITIISIQQIILRLQGEKVVV